MNFRQVKSEKCDVVITDCNNRIGYNVLRSLARKNLNVVVGVDQNSGMAVYSLHKDKIFRHPAFYKNEKAFIKQLYKFFVDKKPHVCIPTGEDIFVVAKHFDQIKDLPVIVPISDFNTLDRLHDKYKSALLAKSLGIPTPETLKPNNKNDIIKFLEKIEGTIVLKILSSSGARGVFYLNENGFFAELDKIMKKEKINFGDFLIQQYIKGIGYGVSMLFNNGQLRAKFAHKRLRERSFTGAPSTLRISIRNIILEEYAERLLSNVGFHGVAMVEFKHNEQTGDSWFIEVNPRFWGSVALAIQSGVDFPYLLYRMAVEGDVAPCLDYKTGITVKWLLGDILGVISYVKARRSIKGLKQVAARVDGYDDFRFDDPFVLPAEFLLYLKKIIGTNYSKQ